jgi:hypothetical protein
MMLTVCCWCAVCCRQAEADAAKAAAAEAKKLRDAEKQAMKKERQRLRKLADGGEGQQRLLSIGAGALLCYCCHLFTVADREQVCQPLHLQQLQQMPTQTDVSSNFSYALLLPCR